MTADRCAHEAPDLSPERVGELAEALGEHRLHASMNICTGCDWRATPYAGSLSEQHETHVAQALVPLVARWVAEAWDEGYETGYDDAIFDQRGLSTDADADEYPHKNPYRADPTEEQR